MKALIYTVTTMLSLAAILTGCTTTTASRSAMPQAKGIVVQSSGKSKTERCIITGQVVTIHPNGERDYM